MAALQSSCLQSSYGMAQTRSAVTKFSFDFNCSHAAELRGEDRQDIRRNAASLRRCALHS